MEPTQEQLLNRLAAAGLKTVEQGSQVPPPATPEQPVTPQTDPAQSTPQPSSPQLGQPEAQPTATQPTQPVKPAYTGPSVTDYLTSIGRPSDVNSRAQLAFSTGLVSSPAEYVSLAKTGRNASINTQLLERIRGQIGGVETLPGISGAEPEEETVPSDGAIVQTPTNSVLAKYGITEPSQDSNPIQSFVDTYKTLFLELGLGDVKSRYDQLVNEEAELKTELQDGIDEINDDPWLSEGVRSTQVERLQKKYESKLDTLTNRLKLTDSLYQSGLDQVKFISQQAYNAYYQDKNLQQDYVMKAMDIAQKQAEAERDLKKTDFSRYRNVDGGLYDLETGKFIVSPTTTSSKKATGTKLTIAKTQSLGLPLSMVGTTEEDVIEDLNSDLPPDWFREMIENKRLMSIPPEKLRGDWTAFKEKFGSDGKGDDFDNL